MNSKLPVNVYFDKRRSTYYVQVRRKTIIKCISGLKQIEFALLMRDFLKSITIEEFKKVNTRRKCFDEFPMG